MPIDAFSFFYQPLKLRNIARVLGAVIVPGAALLAMLLTTGCHNSALDALNQAETQLSSKYTVGGSVSGLSGSGLALENNGGDDLTVPANGAFTFPTALQSGAPYAVTIKTQPTNPAQTCSVTGASGAVGTANVTTVAVSCTTNTYTVGGSVSGLIGSGLALADNGGDVFAVSADGSFTFATSLAAGTAYAVTVSTQPGNPAQTCAVASGSGTIASANVSNVSVTCTTNAAAAVTPVGTPVGSPSTAIIDAAGGSITSPDARLTVTVPVGAVAAATTFSIQPITNQAPGGIGNAYRLGPEGLTFSTPVSITLHYTAVDIAGSSADAQALVYQDAEGRWAADLPGTVDTAAQTVTTWSPHFSDWAAVDGWWIEPRAARVATAESLNLTLWSCFTTTLGGADSLIPYIALCGQVDSSLLSPWSANGIPGGNSTVGTVTSSEPGIGAATYLAPDQVPASNPVAVSITTPVMNLFARHQGKKILVSNITVGGCSLADAKDCIYEGSTDTSTNHWDATAHVTWTFTGYAPDDPMVAVYAPSGTVTLTDLNPGCSVPVDAQPLSAGYPTQLGINYHTSPPTVGGNGTNVTGWEESCTPPANPPLVVGAIWWAAEGIALSADGSTISGSYSFGGLTSTFTFLAKSAPPPAH